MRIISGKWRGRKIIWPRHGGTRPLPDALRESLFNILGSIYAVPGELPDLHVGDFFAGSGSIGLEALSRGAASCTFFEKNPEALAVLNQNLDALQAGPEARVVTVDAWRARPCRESGEPFDLVFLDPPYVQARDITPTGEIPRFLEKLAMSSNPSTRVVLHHEPGIVYAPRHWSGWRCEDRREMGSHAITFFIR
jgi:16S rRNA (guanine(966)-N(2))-methyltransferase RsmD